MLDAQPAANAPARPPAIQPLHTSPAIADTAGVRSKPAALLAAATALLPNLEAGRALDPARGHERGLRRQRRARRLGLEGRLRSGRGRDGAVHPALRPPHAPRGGRRTRIDAAAMLAMLETLAAALEPSQTRRSEEQLALQQFSTPLPLAYAALQAAAIRPGDIVLEPSAGTGMLAVMAECALGKRSNGARSGIPCT